MNGNASTYTDAANTAKSNGKASARLFTQVKTLLLWLVS